MGKRESGSGGNVYNKSGNIVLGQQPAGDSVALYAKPERMRELRMILLEQTKRSIAAKEHKELKEKI